MPTYRRKSFLYLSIVFDSLSLLRSFYNLFAIISQALRASHLHLPMVCRPYRDYLNKIAT